MRINPEREGRGIRFVRIDVSGLPTVSSREVDVHCPPFRTALKNGEAEVHTIEHLMSALAGTGVTDAEIEVDGVELPGLDGSALEYVKLIHAAGVVDAQREVDPLVVTQDIRVEDGPASLEARPFADGLKISYTLHYPGHTLAQGSYEFDFSVEKYANEIAPARTFAIRPEAEKMMALGFGKGANTQNTLIIDGDKVMDTHLRFPDEPVRHKILDLIGDLYVIGRPLRAHLIAKLSGHKANRMLALKLMETYC